jgi:hypothetical protein
LAEVYGNLVIVVILVMEGGLVMEVGQGSVV